MRIRLFTLILSLACFSPFVVRADDFGPRFYNQAPQALGDFTVESEEIENIAMDENLAEELEEIVPAAGEQEKNIDSDKE